MAQVARVLLGAMALSAPARAQATGEAPKAPAAVAPSLPPSLPVPSSYEGLFAERDARARDALAFLSCMEQTARALSGRHAAPTSARLACLRQGAEWRGVVATLPEGASGTPPAGVRVQRQFAMRGGAVPVTSPVDTVAVGRIARALQRGLSAPLPGHGRGAFAPVALMQPTFTEIWFLPLPSMDRLLVGGDSVIQMTTDGTRELGHARRTPPIRTLQPPASGPLVIESTADRLPLVSELLAAHVALPTVGAVRLVGREMESVLVRGGQWTHRARR